MLYAVCSAMVEVLEIIINFAVGVSLTYGLVRFDRARIPAAWRQRGWNEATTGAAIFAFTPFCIVAHFWVTRRSARGLAIGVCSLLLLFVIQVAASLLIDCVMC